MKMKLLLFLISFLFIFDKVNAFYEAPVDITTMSISEIQDAFNKGYLNSELLVNLYLDRINEYDKLYNSINQLNNNALEEAKKLDRMRTEGNILGPLHGIPILVKTNIDVKGLSTTAGTKALIDNYPNEDAFVVKRLIENGAIILGSTNMSELAFSASNSYSSYGYVRNVFNTDSTPYGSSGGSAVSVAASFATASLGTDTNSSVRLPASGAGLVGLRPTLGFVSRNGVIPYDIERDTVGILSKTVSDNALILSIISGEDLNDSYTNNFESYNYNSFEPNVDMSGYNIGVIKQYFYGTGSGITGTTDQEILNLSDNSIIKMKEAGANIVYLDEFYVYKNYAIASSTQAGITMCDNFNEYIKGTTGTIRSFQHLASSGGHVQGLGGYVEGCGHNYKDKSYRDNLKSNYREYVDDIFEKYNLDVVIYPSLKSKPNSYNSNKVYSPGSPLSSVIGYPAITVPMGKDNLGYSYGLEFMSKSNNESLLLNIASSFEKINGNVFEIPSLVPNLYSIPDEVNELKIIYESIDKDLYKNLYNDINNYFINYSSNDNRLSDAVALIERYNNKYLEISIINKTKKYVGSFLGVIKSLKSFLKIILLLLCLCIIRILYLIFIKKRKRKRKNKRFIYKNKR
ncbi:MAG: amidase family protein [Candidatus Coprovivens sp.]